MSPHGAVARQSPCSSSIRGAAQGPGLLPSKALFTEPSAAGSWTLKYQGKKQAEVSAANTGRF